MVVERIRVACLVGNDVVASHQSGGEGGEPREVPRGPFSECRYIADGPSSAIRSCRG